MSDGSLSTGHTLRLASVTPDRLQEVAHKNLDHLQAILDWMSPTPLRLFRLGSSLVPLASHEAISFDWKPLVADRLAQVGEYARAGGFRLSMHPGQYTILNSKNPLTHTRSVAELQYATDVLDLMGLDGTHKIVVHGGGIYGEREESTKRLAAALNELPAPIRRRLVLENDERLFNLEQILGVAEDARLPVVFDLHHHQINPGQADLQEMLNQVASTWDCTPKVHISSQRPDSRLGAHDDYIHAGDLETLANLLPFEADLMIEAKCKERAAMAAWNLLHEGSHVAGTPPLEPHNGGALQTPPDVVRKKARTASPLPT